jgi:TatD DNase family protein
VKILFELMSKHRNMEIDRLFYDIGSRRILNVTRRCNLDCHFCPQSAHVARGDSEQARSRDDEPSLTEIIDAVCGNGNCREVIFSGIGEPTYRLYDLMQAARYLHSKGIRTRLITNGLADRLHGRAIAPDLEDNIDAVCISLNAHDATSYQKNCRPTYENAFGSVLEFIESAKEYVPSVSISTVRGVPGVDVDACRELARKLGVGFEERLLLQPC